MLMDAWIPANKGTQRLKSCWLTFVPVPTQWIVLYNSCILGWTIYCCNQMVKHFLDSYGIKVQTKIQMEKHGCEWPRFVPKAKTVSFVFHTLVFRCGNLPASSLCWLFLLSPQLSFFCLSNIPQAFLVSSLSMKSAGYLPHGTLEAALTPAESMRSAFSVGLKRIVLPSTYIFNCKYRGGLLEQTQEVSSESNQMHSCAYSLHGWALLFRSAEPGKASVVQSAPNMT